MNQHPDRRAAFWAFFLLSAFLLLTFLGQTLFNTKGEPREAIVAYTMLDSHNWVLPVNNGGEMAYKPPFFHWFIAVGAWLTGSVSEYVSRLPSALALLVMLAAGFGFYARRSDTRTALVMGLLTLTTFEVHRAGVNCRVDMLLTACMVGALYLLYMASEPRSGRRSRMGYYVGALLCMSGAMLTKGPVGIVLPCLVGAVYEWLTGRGFWRVAGRYCLLGLGALVVPMLWYAAAYRQGDDAFFRLVWEENVLRFTGKMTYGSHENPPIYNVVTLVAGFVPYTLLVLIGLVVAPWQKLRRWRWQTVWQRLKSMDRLTLFSLLSFLLIFVFYCIPKSKRSVYLLPVYPFLSYFLARYMLWLWERRRGVVVLFGRLVAGAAILVSLAALVLHFVALPEAWLQGHNGALLRSLHDFPWSVWAVVGVGAPLLAGVAYWWTSLRHRDGAGAFWGTLLVPYAIYVALDCHYQPLLLNARSDKAVAARVQQLAPRGPLYSYIYMSDFNTENKLHFFTLNFYLGDRLQQLGEHLPESGLILMGERDYDTHFRPTFGPNYDLRLVADLHHRSCDTKQNLVLYAFRRKK